MKGTAMKVMLPGFWGVWFSVVALTNLGDALKNMGVLPDGYTLVSGNFAFMRQVTAIHHTPEAIVALMFAGVIAWELTAAVLFFRALAGVRSGHSDQKKRVTQAFTVAAALWAAMMIASEVFISYQVEATHTALLIATLVSYLVTGLPSDFTDGPYRHGPDQAKRA
jgi:hypothetical protein